MANEDLVRINHNNQENYLKIQNKLREHDDILNEKDRIINELKRALKDRNSLVIELTNNINSQENNYTGKLSEIREEENQSKSRIDSLINNVKELTNDKINLQKKLMT